MTVVLTGRMPWKEATAVEGRWDFVQAALRREVPFAELCRRFGISRENGYKWRRRFEKRGRPGLVELSRRPKRSPQAMPEEQRQKVLVLRRKYPTWGPRK